MAPAGLQVSSRDCQCRLCVRVEGYWTLSSLRLVEGVGLTWEDLGTQYHGTRVRRRERPLGRRVCRISGN